MRKESEEMNMEKATMVLEGGAPEAYLHLELWTT